MAGNTRSTNQRASVQPKDAISTKKLEDLLEHIDTSMKEIKIFFEKKFQTFEKSFEKKIEDLATSINLEFKDVEEKIEKIEKNISKKYESKILNLENRVMKLESILNKNEYEKIRNNIVIAGLPENIPDPTKTIKSIFEKIEANVEMSDIISVKKQRNQKMNKIIVNYIIELKNYDVKSEIFAKKKIYKNTHLYTEELNLQMKGSSEIFIRNHLTPVQSKLFFQAKKFKIENKFRYLWISDGRILLREEDRSKVYEISSQYDLDQIQLQYRKP